MRNEIVMTNVSKTDPDRQTPPIPLPKPAFISIHGSIKYDFSYRTGIEQSLIPGDVQQHTESINLDILIRDKYPLKLSLNSRQGNSPFFKRFLDLNLGFDQYAYSKNQKNELIKKITQRVKEAPGLKALDDELAKKISQYEKLKMELGSGAALQKLIERKEKKYRAQVDKTSSIDILNNTVVKDLSRWNSKEYTTLRINKPRQPTNPGFSHFGKDLGFQHQEVGKYHDRNRRIDEESIRYQLEDSVNLLDDMFLKSLGDSIQILSMQKDSLRQKNEQRLALVRQQVFRSKSLKDLRVIAEAEGLEPRPFNIKEKLLDGIKSFGIGRTPVNYTELTAQNMIVTGLNVEFNSSWYAALSAGKIDYSFRDFYRRRNSAVNNQYFVLGRIGLGNKDRKAIILSVFQGRKATIGTGYSDTSKNQVAVAGYSLEALLNKNENTGISFEIAKSTNPVTGSLRDNKQAAGLFRFGDKSNLGVNIKAHTVIEETGTRLSGFFRQTGNNFQSFSLFSYNTDQVAWLVRADQSFLKRKLSVTGMLRQNDFTNPFTEKSYRTSTLFKSLQVSFRAPKLPSVSLGYYPGTQLYFIDKEKIRENAYYIFNTSISTNYFVKGRGMNTSFFMNRYFNKATDTGFVLNKGLNYYAMQTIFLTNFLIRTGYAYTKQEQLSFYTLESAVDVTLKTFLKAGGGIKVNKVFTGSKYFGCQFFLSAETKLFGNIMIQYDRTFYPTLKNTMIPLEIGRVSWHKTF
jgi:hypothetical protein